MTTSSSATARAAPRRRAPDAATQDAVGSYLAALGRHKLLSRDDEARLSATIAAGVEARARLDDRTNPMTPAARRRARNAVADAERATEEFICANLRLVVSIARRYQGAGVDLLDLVQEGNIGLMRAIEKFDARRGFKFSTYATWWIRQAIQRGLGAQSATIRIPVHAADFARQVLRVRSELTSGLGRTPTDADVAHHLGVSEASVRDARRAPAVVSSLDAQISHEGTTELGDLIGDVSIDVEGSALDATVRDDIVGLLGALEPRERRIIELRFGFDRGEPRTLEQVASYFALTRERIRQIEARAMVKLRHPSVSDRAAIAAG